MVKEANLSFSLNTHLFSILQPSPADNPKYKGLRYFEIRELEKQEKANRLLLQNGPEIPMSLWSKIERFVWFAVASVVGVILSQLVVPYIARVANAQK